MRPLRSVRHSPRLTNRNGVLTRIAPPNTAINTPHQPSAAWHPCQCARGWKMRKRPYSVSPARISMNAMPCSTSTVASGRSQSTLQQAAARCDTAHEQRDRRDRDRIVARDERHQDAGVAIPRDERCIGAAVHGGDFRHAGQAGRRPAEEAAHQHERDRRQARRDAPRARCRRRCAMRSRRPYSAPENKRTRKTPVRRPVPSARPCRADDRPCWLRRSAAWTACSGSPDRAAALRRND